MKALDLILWGYGLYLGFGMLDDVFSDMKQTKMGLWAVP
jgi:hypothetical protein